MQSVTAMRISVSRGDHDRAMVYMVLELKSGRTRYFTFVCDEWLDFIQGRRDYFGDISHRLSVFMSLWTFYDWPCPSNDSGTVEITYDRIEVVYDIRRRLHEAVVAGLVRYDAQPERTYGGRDSVLIEFDEELKVWRNWHTGAGTCRIDHGYDEPTIERLTALDGHCKSFTRCLDNLRRIATNQTRKPSDVGTVRISYVNGAFYFRFPDGLHGGIINHGSDDEPDWSVHT